MADLLLGIGVSPGRAAGPVLAMGLPPTLPPARAFADAEAEIASAGAALAAVRADLLDRAGRARTSAGRDVLLAQAELADDPVIADDIADRVRDGADAPHAVHGAFTAHRAVFLEVGGFLADRVADLDDLMHRVLAELLDVPMPGVPAPGHPYILVAEDLSPADTAMLDPAQVLGLVTERGGPTSHTAILARALGLPAVVACPDARAAADQGLAIIDGRTGRLQLGVTEADAAAVVAEEAEQRTSTRVSAGPGRTSDGHPVKLLINIGSAADVQDADPGEGVGLFRTEFLFLDRTTEPGVAEQAVAYSAVFAAFPNQPVTVRTLDAGADKPLPFLQRPEPNPALGVRGLRTARRHPEVLANQLRAIAAAAATTTADVRVMAPMVATVAEAAAFTAQCREQGLRTAGIMVEIPAAALRAERLLAVVDFFSLGTNDLAQYTLAADRQSGDLPDLLDPWQPALLRLVADCARAGAAAGKPVGVCGEAAADPLLALVLAGLGVTSLSMSPRSLPGVRAALAGHTMADCQALAEAVLDLDDPAEARDLAARV